MIPAAATLTPVTATPSPAPSASADSQHHGFGFHDLLEIVNPLQHFPVISTLYRAFTGDKIPTFDKIAGDTLYGGAVGFACSMADTIFEKVTGKDFGDTVLSLLTGNHDQQPTAVAANTPAPAATSPTAAAVSGQPDALPHFTPVDLSNVDLSGLSNSGTDQPSAATPQTDKTMSAAVAPDLASLQASLLRAQLDPVMVGRATFAYQRAIGLSPTAPNGVNPPAN